MQGGRARRAVWRVPPVAKSAAAHVAFDDAPTGRVRARPQLGVGFLGALLVLVGELLHGANPPFNVGGLGATRTCCRTGHSTRWRCRLRLGSWRTLGRSLSISDLRSLLARRAARPGGSSSNDLRILTEICVAKVPRIQIVVGLDLQLMPFLVRVVVTDVMMPGPVALLLGPA
eukprot:5576476-Prymnesium_polylepis.1